MHKVVFGKMTSRTPLSLLFRKYTGVNVSINKNKCKIFKRQIICLKDVKRR